MEISGYSFLRDNDFVSGEQYWIYKDNALVGWLCMFCGIIRVTHCQTKDKFPGPFLIHELYGDEPIDKFPSGKAMRALFQRAAVSLDRYYGNSPKPAKALIKQIFGDVEEIDATRLNQMGLF